MNETAASRIEAEISTFKDIDIHALPDSCHYWSMTHLGPHVEAVFGRNNLIEVFAAELIASIKRTGNSDILSIGAGDGQVDMLVAREMLNQGCEQFRFECRELSPFLIERGREAAAAQDLTSHIVFEETDINVWQATRQYGGAFAHHSLHHIVELEHIFDQVRDHLAPGGAFVTSDMIGRNGHMRWPEVRAPLERIWSTCPPHYRFNHQLQRQVDPFEDWDCSTEGFEGVRAQDILPLLVERFHFSHLCVWGGVLDTFINRGFGHNLRPDNPQDTAFIDTLWESDCAMMRAGAIAPTHIAAVMRTEPCALVSSFGLSPEHCVRRPEHAPHPQD